MLANWLISKKAGHPGGQRLPKWRKYEEPKVIVPYTGGSYYSRAPKVYQDTLSTQGDTHRFWAIDHRGMSKCRACETELWLDVDRKLHLSHEGCAKKLVAAYKLLMRDMRCVMCDMPAVTMRWGVPMHVHAGDCMERWLKEAQPISLHDALMLVLRQGDW